MKYPPKLFYLLCLSLLLFSSCKKVVENKQLELLTKAITDGLWYVVNYKEDDNGLTYLFNGYEFQFYEDGRVDGIKQGVTSSGTWTGDISTSTITAAFPGAGDPLMRLSATWTLTDTYLNYVESKRMVDQKEYLLFIRKKE